MIQVDIPELNPDFINFINLMNQHGEDSIVITRNGNPVITLTRPVPAPAKKRIGVAKGKFTVPEDFDKWDSDVADMFEGYL